MECNPQSKIEKKYKIVFRRGIDSITKDLISVHDDD